MTNGPGGEAGRRSELATRLQEVQARISAACGAAGRSPDEITLIAVTKTYPAADIRLLSELSVTDIGENRDQEAAPKAAECAAMGLRLTWHFVGQLQRNKARSVIGYADVIHSVDRVRLARALGSQTRAAERTVTCLVQVSLDGDPERGGAYGDQIMAVASALAAEDGLSLGGVMAVAPQDMSAGAAFARLADVAQAVRGQHPQAVMISAGMSGDLEEAIAAGATHLRVGTALLGGRRAFVR